jgi:hypothetical protein
VFITVVSASHPEDTGGFRGAGVSGDVKTQGVFPGQVDDLSCFESRELRRALGSHVT